MNSERSDAEYILIGKIAEKRKELLKLKEELHNMEGASKNTVIQEDVAHYRIQPSFEVSPVFETVFVL